MKVIGLSNALGVVQLRKHNKVYKAIITNDSGIIFCKNYKTHRNNLPAIYNTRQHSKMFFKNGKLHSTNGPAIIMVGQYKEWWFDGDCYGINSKFNKLSWKKHVKKLKINKKFSIFK